jgi:O-antigen/teichoic acid export membrane protein
MTLVFTTLSSRMLGPRAAADFFTGVFVLAFALTAAGPLGGTAARFAARHRVRGEVEALRALPVSLSLVAAMAVVGVLGLLGLAFAGGAFAPESLSPAWWGVTLWTSIVLVFVALARGMLRGLGRFGAFNESVLVESGCRLALGLCLVGALRSAAAGLAGYAIAATLSLLLAARQVRRAIGSGPRTRPEPGRHLGFLLPMAAMAFAHAAFQNLDVLVVRGLFDPAEAGAYGAAAVLAHTATMLLTPFSTTLLPDAARLHGENGALQRDGVRLLARHVAGYLAVCLPLLLVFALAGEWLMTLLYGSAFSAGGAWLPILTASVVSGGLGLLVMQCLAAQGRFGFLLPYGLGVIGAFGWIAQTASSPAGIAGVLVVGKLATLGVLVGLFLRSLSGAGTGAAAKAHAAPGVGPLASPSTGPGGGR